MKLGIRSKVILVPATILLLAVAGNVLLVGTKFRHEYADALRASVRVIADNLKLQLERLFELGFPLHDIEGFDAQCREKLNENPDLSFVGIADTDGKVLFSAFRGSVLRWEPQSLMALDDRAATAQRAVMPVSRSLDGTEHYLVVSPVTDHFEKTIAWAVVGFPRERIDERIRLITLWSIGVASASMISAMVLLWLVLSTLVTRPLSGLLAAIQQIRSSGQMDRDVNIGSSDEIGQLAQSFNGMIRNIRDRDAQIQQNLRALQRARDELEIRVQERTVDLRRTNHELEQEILLRKEAESVREQMHANLVEASRKAGMADVATGVLHNVGNVLNSVNVSVQLVHEALKGSQLATLLKAADLIEQNQTDLPNFFGNDERGRQLPAFICKLARHLGAERDGLMSEIDDLGRNINHIKEIVSMQQTLARVSGVMSDVPVDELINDALKINQAGLGRHGVRVDRQTDPELKICTDRHKVLQILINLVSNAKYALSGLPEDSRILTVTASRIDGDRVRIDISDTGVGIAPENMAKIFNYGFTTKSAGHGFGLHSSALAAKELHGALTAHSDGLGKGATFTLILPVSAKEDDTCPNQMTNSCVAS